MNICIFGVDFCISIEHISLEMLSNTCEFRQNLTGPNVNAEPVYGLTIQHSRR